MRNIYFILIILSFSCKAQNIVSIYNTPLSAPQAPYYKDIDSDFNPLEGEWKWENGNSSLTIQMQKMTMISQGNGYSDIMIGEYKYIENGTELVNYLPLVPNTSNLQTHNLWGGIITTLNKGFPPCAECAPNTRFIIVSVTETDKPGLYGKMVMAHFTENNVEKIRMRIWNTYNENVSVDYTGPNDITIPEGVYTLVKQ